MLETLRCPSCSTRYGLRASRVRPGIRRAKCLKCGETFGIAQEVERLLAAPPQVPAPEPQPAPAYGELPPSLTLGDLDGAEDGILDQVAGEEPGAPAVPAPDPAGEEPEGPHYASAKEAIAKLMGAPQEPAAPSRPTRTTGSMDMEATLDALESTLGGTPVHALEAKAAPQADTASTVRLSSREIQAALASAGPQSPTGPRPETLPAPPPAPAPVAPPTAQDPNLLKVQLEGETATNLTLDQVIAWIEQGKVQEYHMVARQFSDHWIEASKVPSLRPVFDRRRKAAAPAQLPAAPPPEIQPAKRSLFGGLFHRN